MKNCLFVLFIVILVVSLFIVCRREEKPSPFQVQVLNDYVTAVLGGGGNSLVIKGKEACVVVDAKNVEVAEAFKKQIALVSGQPVGYLVNTHWHADHVSGNAVVGANAVIVAHEKTCKHMAEGREMTFFGGFRDPYDSAWLPDTTFSSRFVIENPNEPVELLYRGPGHTDGDIVVWLRKSNILQTGDIYFNGMYPYIGIEAGGSIHFMIDRVSELLERIDEKTIVVPGHGPVSNKNELAAYLKMLTGVREAVQKYIDQGMDEAAVIAAKPTESYDEMWENGFLNADSFARLVYMDLSR